jgi:itaconyl-CoA hydratase
MDDVRILKPTYPGDTLRASTRVLTTRVSKSKPDRGILTVETWAVNQRGQRVIEFKRSIMLFRKGHGPATEQAVFREESS